MYYKEYGIIISNTKKELAFPYRYAFNIALQMCVFNLYRDMQTVASYLGTSITFDMNYKYHFFTAEDITNLLVHNGFKVILTVNSELQNKVKMTVMWTNEEQLSHNIIQR